MNPFIGQIQAFGFNFAPRGWAFCNGALLPIAQNTALFSLLGTIYGGDGRTTFGLPNVQGRAMIHQGTGPGLPTYRIGQGLGSDSISLNSNNIPSHSHTATLLAGNGLGNSATAGGNQLAANTGADTIFNSSGSTTDMATGNVTVGATGGNQPINIRNPYLGINVCIALQGLYPSRS